MRIDGGLALRWALLAALGAGLLVAGWRIPSDADYTDSARIDEPITVSEGIHIVPSDLDPAYSRAYAEAVASQSFPGAERLPIIDTWLGYYDGLPEDARGLVYVVSLDPGPDRYTCNVGPSGAQVVCPNYRTIDMTSVVSATTGERVLSAERAEPYSPPAGP